VKVSQKEEGLVSLHFFFLLALSRIDSVGRPAGTARRGAARDIQIQQVEVVVVVRVGRTERRAGGEDS
jgi:hypothetical protein